MSRLHAIDRIAARRELRRQFARLDAGYRQPAARVLLALCVPALAWSVLALLWTLPVPPDLLRPGAWAVAAIVLAFYWHWRRARRLAVALLAALALLALLADAVGAQCGTAVLRAWGGGAFVAAGAGWIAANACEGRWPRLTDLAALPITPAWQMASLLRAAGLRDIA